MPILILLCTAGFEITRPMSLKFRLLSFLSRNTLSRKHDVGVLFTWALNASTVTPKVLGATHHFDSVSDKHHPKLLRSSTILASSINVGNPGNVDLKLSYVSFGKFWPV